MTVTDENKDSEYITKLEHKINSFCIVLEAQKKQIAKLNAIIAQKWISVDDKLPLEGINNIVLATDGDNYETAYYFRKNFITTDGLFHSVTHWTHIPEFNERMDECK